MSSFEIAELTGKRHDNVMRDIRSMLNELMGGAALSFEGSYVDPTGRSLPCFHLPKRECLILVSGYDIKLRARIIDRWQDLEAKAAAQPPAPAIDLSDPKVLLAYLETNTRALVQANDRLAIVEPKAAALDRIEGSDGLFSIARPRRSSRCPSAGPANGCSGR